MAKIRVTTSRHRVWKQYSRRV